MSRVYFRPGPGGGLLIGQSIVDLAQELSRVLAGVPAGAALAALRVCRAVALGTADQLEAPLARPLVEQLETWVDTVIAPDVLRQLALPGPPKPGPEGVH